jgi:hypothetical protein
MELGISSRTRLPRGLISHNEKSSGKQCGSASATLDEYSSSAAGLRVLDLFQLYERDPCDTFWVDISPASSSIVPNVILYRTGT